MASKFIKVKVLMACLLAGILISCLNLTRKNLGPLVSRSEAESKANGFYVCKYDWRYIPNGQISDSIYGQSQPFAVETAFAEYIFRYLNMDDDSVVASSNAKHFVAFFYNIRHDVHFINLGNRGERSNEDLGHCRFASRMRPANGATNLDFNKDTLRINVVHVPECLHDSLYKWGGIYTRLCDIDYEEGLRAGEVLLGTLLFIKGKIEVLQDDSVYIVTERKKDF